MTDSIAKQIVPQTKEWIEGISIQFREAKSEQELVSLGASYLRLTTVPEVVKAAWLEFQACMKKFVDPGAKRRVVAVDFPAIFHSQFKANEDNLSDVTAKVVSKLESIYQDADCNDETPFILAHDGQDNWRKKVFPAYKGTRPAKHESFDEVMQDALQACRKAGWVIVEIDGYESDDVLASIAYRTKLRRQEATLVTEDKDVWQCLGKGVVMHSPRTGKYFNADTLMAKVSITPQQVVDYLCFVGKNDVPKVKGIDKKASELLAVYGTFWGIYDARESLKPAKKASIESFAKDGYWLARDLHTLRKGLEVFW